MKPNPYKVPNDPPLGPKEYQPVVSGGGSVPLSARLAAVVLPMLSTAIGTWAAALLFVINIPADLTLPGHVVACAFGGTVGALVGLVMIAIMHTQSSPLRRYQPIAILVAAIVAPVFAIALLFFMSESHLIPLEVMDWLVL